MTYVYRIERVFALLVFFVLALPAYAFAVSAAPVEHTLRQADGAEIRVKQWGDEYRHGVRTLDGYHLVFNKATGNWVYAIADREGKPKASSFVAGKDLPPSDALRRPTKPAPSHPLFKKSLMRSAAQPVHTLGTENIAMILVNFSDTTTTYTRQDFESTLFGTGVNSMKDYFEEASYGAFSITGGPSGVHDWVSAPNGHDYYGANDPIYEYDFRAPELVSAAVAVADPDFDFSQYDGDGDCIVDALLVVHQGVGEEVSASPSDIWSHQSELAHGYGITNDDCLSSPSEKVSIGRYITVPERMDDANGGGIMTIGVIAHELGHILGLPDLYDIDYSSSGVGGWDLMATGSWNKVSVFGDSPAHFSAWSKMSLFWLTPQIVNGTLAAESIGAAETAKDVYKFLEGSEYFLVENRQKTGFDAGLPGSGLAIWHIDENRTFSDNTDNSRECIPIIENCATYHFRVALMQADGLFDLENNHAGDSGDLYPGSSNNNAFGADTVPSSNLYNGAASNVVVSAIGASASTMTATLAIRSNNAPAAPILVYPENGAGGICSSVTLKWQRASDSDGDAVDYRLYIGTDPYFASTRAVTVASSKTTGEAMPLHFAGPAAFFLVGLAVGGRRRIFFVLIGLVLAGAISCGGDLATTADPDCSDSPSIGAGESGYQVNGLLPGATYYWKVLSDDGWGGRTESETRRFTAR